MFVHAGLAAKPVRSSHETGACVIDIVEVAVASSLLLREVVLAIRINGSCRY